MLSTSMANRLVRYKDLHNYDLSSIKVLLVGGATLKEESQDSLKKHLGDTLVLQAYGKGYNDKHFAIVCEPDEYRYTDFSPQA